ncbi:hypothetical protein [Gordonia terrae]|nr:hypothetical protein [Gordonia terrae]GAB43340.1 hypothetical protein GOTRE_039_01810 [Gordonia terrae NBRC 100016]VTR06880.1 Uncharacterised protein [Clostridioides difficile]VTS37461.1 Uncharacterised protein [Gordonia terrae]
MSGHPPLTKVIMDSWRPWELAEAKLTCLANAIRENSEAAERTVDQVPNTSWAGGARSAANARASDQNGWAKKVAAKVDDLQTALNNAAAAIDSSKTAVNGALLGASMQRFLLVSESDPSWKMRYVPKEDDELTPGQIADMEGEMTSFVKGKADELATTASDHAALIQTAVGNLNTIAPPALTLSAQDGRRHGQLAADGWTDEEAAAVGRSLRAAGLSDEQIARLMNGEKLDDVPRGVQEYLHTFYGSVGSDGLFDLKSKFDGMHTPTGDAWSKALGQGLLTLSNENVGANTGYQYLPGWVQDWASNHNSNDGARIRNFDVPLAGLLANSGNVSPGERFGTELIRKAAGGASRSADDSGLIAPEINYGGPRDGHETLTRTYEDTIRTFMDVGTRNHEASAAILTGEYSSGEELADYDRDNMLGYVLKHDWEDGGDAAGGLIDWIRDDGTSGDPAQTALADRAFTGLFDYATTTDGDNNFAGLMNANSSGDAVGKINPHLAQALREASLPYLNILAGGHSEVHGHPGFDPSLDASELQQRTARLFTLIASDNTYGQPTSENPDGTGAGADLYRDILDQTIRNGALAAEDFSSDPDRARSLSTLSANLRALGQAGLYGAEYDLQIDENISAEEKNATGSKIRNIVASASAGLTGVPHPAVIAAGAAGTAASPWLFPAESAGDLDFRPPPGTVGGGSASEDELHLVYGALSATEGIPDIGGKSEAWYGSDGRLKPLAQILSEHNGDTGELLGAMERALGSESSLVASLHAGTSTGDTDGRKHFDPTDPDNYDNMILNGPE